MSQQVLVSLSLATGVAFGFLVAWFSYRADRVNVYTRGRSEGEQERIQLQERIRAKEESAQAVQQQAAEKIALIHESQQKLLDNLRESLQERTGMLEEQLAASRREASAQQVESAGLRTLLAEANAKLEAQQGVGETFKALTAELQPLRTSLERVDLSVLELEKNRAAAHAGLSEQVGILLDGQAQLRQETTGLEKSLRAQAATGSWGEMQLRRVVELSGMVEFCDFEQARSGEKADRTQRADLLVRLPNGRQVAVDAKIPLQAYREAVETTSETGRQAKLAEYAGQVRAHLAQLGSKKYWKQFAAGPEFVVAFIPGEIFFSAALEQDPGLIEFGVEQRVILATPTTLIALLKAISYGWQQNQLTENARQISQLGQTLYDRLYAFSGHMEDIRRNLQRTVDSYNKASGTLERGVLVTARRFQELGAREAAIEFLEPVDTVPRGLHALEQATLAPGTDPEPASQEEAVPGSVEAAAV